MPSSFANPSVSDPTISATTNRLTSSGYTYDNAGNTTADAGGQSYVYDAENKMASAWNGSGTLGQYSYDGDGKRVKKYVPDTGEVTVFVYDASGKQVAEYSTVVQTSAAQVAYLTNDSLGSPRINTDANGAVISRHDYHPFGEEIDGSGGRTTGLGYGSDSVRKQFTGYERDNETGLDFAKNRFHNFGLGRFTSPDPYKIVAEIEFEKTEENATAKLNNYLSKPQQWNAYAYVINNPYRYTNTTGEIIKLTGTDAEVQEKLKRLNDFLGDERFNLIKKSSDGRFLFLNDKDICGGNFSKFANIGNNAETKDFSRKFAEILANPSAVRFNIGTEVAIKADINVFGYQNYTKYDVEKRGGGGATVPASESLSGDIEIWVSPNAAQVGNLKAARENGSVRTTTGTAKELMRKQTATSLLDPIQLQSISLKIINRMMNWELFL